MAELNTGGNGKDKKVRSKKVDKIYLKILLSAKNTLRQNYII